MLPAVLVIVITPVDLDRHKFSIKWSRSRVRTALDVVSRNTRFEKGSEMLTSCEGRSWQRPAFVL